MPQFPVTCGLKAHDRDYDASSGGVTITLAGLPHTIKTVQARRIAEGGNLSTMLAPTTARVSYINDGSNCIITDAEAKEYTVTLFTIELDDGYPPPPPPPPAPGRRATFFGTGRVLTYQGRSPDYITLALTDVIPKKDIPTAFFTPQYSCYKLRMELEGVSMMFVQHFPRTDIVDIYHRFKFGGYTPVAEYYFQSLTDTNLYTLLDALDHSNIFNYFGFNFDTYKIKSTITYLETSPRPTPKPKPEPEPIPKGSLVFVGTGLLGSNTRSPYGTYSVALTVAVPSEKIPTGYFSPKYACYSLTMRLERISIMRAKNTRKQNCQCISHNYNSDFYRRSDFLFPGADRHKFELSDGGIQRYI